MKERRNKPASENQSPAGPANLHVWSALADLYRRMSPALHRQFVFVLVLMLLNTVAELGTIGSVLPFISLLVDARNAGEFDWVAPVFKALGAETDRARLITATALFSLFAIFAGLVRLQLARSTQQFGFNLGREVLHDVQRRLLHQPYSFHIQRNTSTLLTAIEKTEILICDVLLPLMQAAIASVIAAAIVAVLIYIDPFIGLVAVASFSSIYLVVSRIAHRRLRANSSAVATGFDERMKIAQESLGGIRDVIIDGTQATFLRLFDAENRKLSQARAETAFIASAPRFVIEMVGMVIIAGLALAASQRAGGLASALPVFAALVLGAQRLLPLVQQMYGGWSISAGYLSVFWQMLDFLALPVDSPNGGHKPVEPLLFRNRITLDQVSFCYPSRRESALTDISMNIPIGSTVVLVGQTGSGKSTLADLIMGLLEPTRGRILIDEVALTNATRRRWQRSIAHVPQSVFLADTSIASNIAFGSEEGSIDRKQVEDAARKAELHSLIESLPDGYDTMVGERGVRLSGGQRQRIGLARAIYKQTPVLVLDEATNALDEATEAAVMHSLAKLGEEGRTIIIIAHRLSKVVRCDFIARLHKGRLVEFTPWRQSAELPSRV